MAAKGKEDFYPVKFISDRDSASLRKGYQLYGRFRVISETFEETTYAEDNPGLQRIAYGSNPVSALYWRPFYYEGNLEYYTYVEGDEYLQLINPKNPNAISARTGKQIFTAAGKSTVSFSTGYTMTYNNEVYVATAYSVQFEKTGEPASANPYVNSYVRVWHKTTDLKVVKTLYWWNPKYKRFLAFPATFTSSDTQGRQVSLALGAFAKTSLTESNRIFLREVNDPSISQAAREQMIQARVQYLISQGYSEAQAKAAIGQQGEVAEIPTPTGGTGSSRSSLGRGQSDNGQNTVNTTNQTATTVTLRGRFGYVAPGQDPRIPETDDFGTTGVFPQMIQYYSNDGMNPSEPRRYTFFLRPTNINYTNIGSEWTEIERSGKIPIVDWKNFKLMKISFQFVVGNPTRLTTSVDAELKVLRQMAASPYPVVIYGFDEMFNNDLRFPFADTQTVEFAIADMSISSVLRTPDNKINRATVDITLQELPIETVSVIEMPKLAYKPTITTTPTVTPPSYGGRRLFEDELLGK